MERLHAGGFRRPAGDGRGTDGQAVECVRRGAGESVVASRHEMFGKYRPGNPFHTKEAPEVSRVHG
jgi:hypothetical protein